MLNNDIEIIESTPVNETVNEELPIEPAIEPTNEEPAMSYYQKNKDKIKANQKQKVICNCCGRSIRKYQLKQHLKTAICINNRKPEPKSNDEPNENMKMFMKAILNYLVEK